MLIRQGESRWLRNGDENHDLTNRLGICAAQRELHCSCLHFGETREVNRLRSLLFGQSFCLSFGVLISSPAIVQLSQQPIKQTTQFELRDLWEKPNAEAAEEKGAEKQETSPFLCEFSVSLQVTIPFVGRLRESDQ